MDIIFEKAIIQGDLTSVKNMVYNGDIQVTKKHVHICHTMKKLCISNDNDSIFDNIESFLKQEYKPLIKYSLCTKLFGI